MSDRAALIIFAGIVVFLGLVFLTVDGSALFLARKVADLIDWLAFWR